VTLLAQGSVRSTKRSISTVAFDRAMIQYDGRFLDSKEDFIVVASKLVERHPL
jgi:hypothetical protein